jgi:hypothetical protein
MGGRNHAVMRLLGLADAGGAFGCVIDDRRYFLRF